MVVPVAPIVEPFTVVHSEFRTSGKAIAPAVGAQLGMFGLHEAGGVLSHGSFPGPGQGAAAHWMISVAVCSGALQPGPNTLMPYACEAGGMKESCA